MISTEVGNGVGFEQINQLPLAGPLTGLEEVPLWQSGPVRTTIAGIIASGGNYLDPANYGVFDPTGVLPSDAALQLAINQNIATRIPVWTGPGNFLLTNTINMANAYQDAATLIGAGGAYLPASPAQNYSCPTTFTVNFTNAPAFSINSARGTVMKDFGIIGLNIAPRSVTVPVDIPASYITSGCRNNNGVGANGAAQFSPYCAISVDWSNSAVPTDGGYPTLTNQYHGSTFDGSSGLLFQNISIANFVVGVSHSTSGVGGQGDQTLYENVSIYYCDTGYSFTQAQSKIVTIRDGIVEFCRQAYDGITYGPGQGCPPYLDRPHNEFCYRSFQFQDSFGNLHLNNPFMESVRCIGTYGTGFSSARNSLVIVGGDIRLRTTGFGPLPPVPLETFAPAIFKGVNVVCDVTLPSINFISDGPTIDFENGSIVGSSVSNVPPFIGLCANSSGAMRVKNTWINGVNGFSISDYTSAIDISNFAVSNRLITTGQADWYPSGTGIVAYISGSATLSITVSALTLNVSSVTFTAADPTLLVVGDQFFWTMITQGASTSRRKVLALQITGIVGSAVTCALTCDNSEYDTVANQSSTTSLIVAQGQWAPTASFTCTTDGSTAVITAVTPTGISKNGDWVVATAGFAANSRIVSGAGTGTVTLNKATTAAETANNMWWGRLNTPTLTATW